ncbi:MAG: hypothetical protein K2O42_07805 [Oscillospiraceae bacterium]|nr:hypothetical protein [Oscillospiraceae bacterium]
MKKSVTVTISEEKLSAVEMYLGQKSTSLEAELTRYAEQLYLKNVPQNVRDFIDMMSEKKSAKKPKSSSASDTTVSSEQ